MARSTIASGRKFQFCFAQVRKTRRILLRSEVLDMKKRMQECVSGELMSQNLLLKGWPTETNYTVVREPYMHGLVRVGRLEVCGSTNFVDMKAWNDLVWNADGKTGIIMNEINCIKNDQSLINASKKFPWCWDHRRRSKEKTFIFCMLLVKSLISKDKFLHRFFWL